MKHRIVWVVALALLSACAREMPTEPVDSGGPPLTPGQNGGWSGPEGEDVWEPDNSPSSAGTITVGDPPQTHTIHAPDEYDFVSFFAVSGTTYIIETSNLRGGLDTVIILVLRDGESMLLMNDDSGWDGGASCIIWTCSASGTYYVEVFDYERGGDPGKFYDIAVSVW